jgi:hypothetical protein
VSGVSDALKAVRNAILLEERITSQAKKVEQLALSVVEMDKRLSAFEGRMDGFLAAASAFAAGARHREKAIEAAEKDQPGLPPAQES